ncbi:PKD domain-containing protein [Microbulbifer litoralis]|uniref:PKD domain-containing protein n=1 Tax=Microbulbifer litoralis TaxID=2933965 RepID=UPI0020280EE0|nr:PKD domain-containing protein [Microbulbifer sp. GX H0434]
MAVLLRPLLLFSLILTLAACSGGGGGNDTDPGPPRPTASASADMTEVHAGEDTITLDGSASSSENGSITSWQWSILSQPEGSEAIIENADASQASFSPDLPGTYVIRLEINDGTAASEDTGSSRVTITALDPNPQAVLEPEINWTVGTVQLDGSRSTPPDGGEALALIYHWELTQKPRDSTAELDQGNLIYPRFDADLVGEYKARLVVEYNGRMSEPATTTIRVVDANAIPVAKVAPLEEEVMLGDTVTLDGSMSEDANGDPLQYRWRLLGKPNGSMARLSATTTARTSFVADSRDGLGRYTVELCVFDGIARNCTSERIEVGLPENAGDTPPVAILTPGSSFTQEIERGAVITIRGGDSYDLEGDALSYDWSLSAHPEGYDAAADDTYQGIVSFCSLGLYPCTSMEFVPSVDGEYTWQLTVSDGTSTSTTSMTFTAMLGANRPPDAEAETSTRNPTTMAGLVVTLDGEESSDPDDNRLTYQWAIIQRPDNSSAELQGASTATPSFTADAPGPYLLELQVTDEHGAKSNISDVVVIAKATNHAPVTRILKGTAAGRHHSLPEPKWDIEQPFAITGEKFGGESGSEWRADYFTATADSYDPDGDELTHLWTIVEQPAGNIMEKNGVGPVYYPPRPPCDFSETNNELTCSHFYVSPTEPGIYVFNYQVFDGMDFAGPYTVTAHTVHRENYPTLLLEMPGNRSGGPDYTQTVFPEQRTWGVNLSLGDAAETLTLFDYRLTAAGGDYTLNVENYSSDPQYTSTLVNLDTGEAIRDGFVLKQGETIRIGVQFPMPAIPATCEEANQFATQLNSVDIHNTVSIAGKHDWKIELLKSNYASVSGCNS